MLTSSSAAAVFALAGCLGAGSAFSLHLTPSTARARANAGVRMSAQGDADLLVRALRGEDVERSPVWLMRQAGRYMADFRAYSDKYPFRTRSETPEIAVELSLQPWRSFGVDGVVSRSISLPLRSILAANVDHVLRHPHSAAGHGRRLHDRAREGSQDPGHNQGGGGPPPHHGAERRGPGGALHSTHLAGYLLSSQPLF